MAGEIFRRINNESGIVRASSWATIKQDTPGNTYYNLSTVEAKSTSIANAYEGSSLSTKYLLAFDGGITAQPVVGGAFADFRFVFENNFLANVQYTSTLIGGRSVSLRMRIRPYTAVYDLSTVTWNSFFATPPTFSPQTYTRDICTGSTTDTSAQTVGASGYSAVIIGRPEQTHFGYVIDVSPLVTTAYLPSAANAQISTVTSSADYGGNLFVQKYY